MTHYVDYVLDRVTMYRLVLYYLVAILLVALGLSIAGLLTYAVPGILVSVAVLLAICAVTNAVFAKVFEVPTNIESSYITALILACILPPVRSIHDLPLLGWAAVLSMASKYVLAIRNKHVFNPAAIAVVLTGLWLNQSAIWWVGTGAMLPVILIGGLLMIRKMRRYDMVFSFCMAVLVTAGGLTVIAGHDVIIAISEVVVRSPLVFFAFVMLTEPLTAPPTKFLQILYGGLVGILFAPQVHFGSLYLTPEMALVVGNIFAYVVSPKIKERLTLVNRMNLGGDIHEFEFKPARPFAFRPGQYMEFTLPHAHADSRGNRRYFTLASSPTEVTVRLGMKFYPNGSSFKKGMDALAVGQALMAGQLAGDFTLPGNAAEKLVFMAGGIGITPFRSMLKYLIDTNERRDITLIYVNSGPEDIAYRELLDVATATLGTNVVHTLTMPPPEWAGRRGRISDELVKEVVPDFQDRTFYISGPHAMVAGAEEVVKRLGVAPARIKKDFFPGLT